MPDPVKIDIKSTADTGGVKSATGALEALERGAAHAGDQWEHLGKRIARKFSAADIGKEVLSGLGIGSGFALAERAASFIEEHFRAAAEFAKMIADESERQLAAVEKAIRLKQTDVQALATLRAAQEKGQRDYNDAIAPKTYSQALPLDRVSKQSVTAIRPFTNEELAAAEKLKTANSDRANAITELELAIRSAADAERALIAEDTRYAQEVKKINDLVGEGGLKREEADKRLAQLATERAEKQAKESAERIKLQQDEGDKIDAAQKKITDSLRQAAQKFRELADPQAKYMEQIKEIDQLSRTFAANGQPFLSAQDAAAAKARLLAEMNDDAGKAIRATREEVEKYDIALSVLDKNPALSDQEKQRERIRLINEQTAAINRAKEALTAFMVAHPGVDVGALTEALSRFGDKTARNAGEAQPTQTLAQRDRNSLDDLTDPAKHYQNQGDATKGGYGSFLTSLGTQADAAATAIEGGLNGALQGTSDLLYNAFTQAKSFKEAWNNAIVATGQTFARMAADMVAKLIWRSTVERALVALGVTTHVAGETAKTTATAAGTGARLLLIIKEALAAVYHGAVSAFSAMASIPYVGPILGAAALAAALALGIGLVSKIGHKDGGFTARGPADRPAGIVHAGEWVAPKWMVEDKRFATMIGTLEAARTGRRGYADGGLVSWLFPTPKQLLDRTLHPPGTRSLGHKLFGGGDPKGLGTFNYDWDAKSWSQDLAGVSRSVASQIPPAAAVSPMTGSGSAGQSDRPISIAVIDSRDDDAYERFIRDPRSESFVVRVMKKNRRELGVKV